jgi:hypothetical protein
MISAGTVLPVLRSFAIAHFESVKTGPGPSSAGRATSPLPRPCRSRGYGMDLGPPPLAASLLWGGDQNRIGFPPERWGQQRVRPTFRCCASSPAAPALRHRYGSLSKVRATRSPTLPSRRSEGGPTRLADRRFFASKYQEPLRATWRFGTGLLRQTEPSDGAFS